MGSLDVWGAIAASVLLIQCLIFNLIFLGIALGLWKGTEWLHLRTHAGFVKVNEWLAMGRSYLHKGESMLAAPFVRLQGRIAGWRAARAPLRTAASSVSSRTTSASNT